MLETGARIGPYEILARIGAGGMGEVYRARDSGLGRDVAIKALPDELSHDPERLARFRREATLLAALNHPQVAAIYGLEQSEGRPFLVLELVEGEDLAERLRRGPIPTDEVLEIGRQIAEALEDAHEKGIVHRDLKPGNVKLTQDGKVKVLDFGLAKAVAAEPANGQSTDELSHSPTLARTGTMAGAILGTAAYMSPEQALGRRVDRRADIWSFGVVLFEMLAGRRLFAGETPSEILAAVIKDEPDWQALPRDGTPAALRRLLERCLRKDPRNRLQHIGDARLELAAAAVETADASPEGTRAPRASRALPWALAVLGLGAGAAAWLAPRSGPPAPSRPLTRTIIRLPPDAPLAPSGSFFLSAGSPALALAPDGRSLVYVALAGETRQLFRRDMGTGEVAPIPGTQDAQGPFFSPDSEWVGFFAEGKLKKIRVGGDEAQVVADAVWGHGGEWGADGYLYFCPTELRGISRVPSVGGSAELVTHRTPSDYMHVWPALVPGTRQILVSRVIAGADSVAVARLGGEDPPTTLISGSAGRYAPSGHLVFARQGRLLASSYDLATGQLIGQPAVMIEDVRTEDRGAVQATWSDDGTLVYARGGDARAARLVWIDREGGRLPLALPTARYGAFAVSPTGSTLAYLDPEFRVWLHDLKRGGAPRLLTTEGRDSRRSWGGPAWEPDGRGLYLEATSPSGPGVFHFATEGSERAPVQVISGFAQTVATTSAGIVYATKEGIVYLPRGETQERLDPGRGQLVVAVPDAQMLFPAVSPDERWLAYTSDESGHWEVYVTSFPDAGTKRRVSFAGGEEPRWRPDGRAILYRFGSQWYSVAFASDPELALGTPDVLFQGPYVNVDGYSWDIAPDGRRFLVLENPEMGRPLTELIVLTGFFDELRRRLPAAP